MYFFYGKKKDDKKVDTSEKPIKQSGVSKNLEAGKTYFGIPAEEAKGKWKEMAEIKALVKGKEK